MTTVASELLKELQVQKDLLTTQKDILELKTQIAALSKAVETASAPAADAPAEPAVEGAEEAAEAEAAAEEGSTSAASYLAEITAYEVLKATAKRVGDQLTELTDSDQVLVLGDQCLAVRCLPLSDVALHQTKKQIEIIQDRADLQISVLDSFLTPPVKMVELGEEGEAEEEEEEEEKPLYEVIASFLTGWGGPVETAGELVKSVGDLLGQFASTVTFQERDVTLPLEALVTATAGVIPRGSAHLLSLGRIGTTPVAPDSVLGMLDGLVNAIQRLEEKRIRLTAAVVVPLNAEALKRANNITKLETSKEALVTEITATKKRIGELKVKKQHETDPAKKAELQKEIDLETPGLQLLQGQLTTMTDSLAQERQELEAINLRLTKANAEVEVAANLVKTFTTFFQGITTKPDNTTLSTLAQAVLREYVTGFDYLLRLSIHSGGAETITRKLFRFESRRFVGGCAVSYTLATTDGEVVKSGLEVAAGQRRFSFSNPAETTLERIPPYEAT